MFQQSEHSEIMTIIYLINHSTRSEFRIPNSRRGRFQPVEPVRLTGRRVGIDPYGPEAEIRIPFYASAGSSSPSATSEDSKVSGGGTSSTAVSIGFNSRS